MDNFINITKSLEDSGVLIDGVTEVVNHEIKTRRWFSWCFVSIFGWFSGTNYDFFSSKRHCWKSNHESMKRIL